MPTPVATARLCLREEAGGVLDDAVAVAIKRRNLQTTSLHAVSALLLSPSSYTLLRHSLTRTRSSSAYSPGLQLRALELCVGLSLDRLPSSSSSSSSKKKTSSNHHDYSDFTPPPVSNSLMAAIKRSQVNQRRQHPADMFLMSQVSGGGGGGLMSTSCVKVELKHFILSILDDPIVSRVFAEAGFPSGDVKLMIVNHSPLPLGPTRFPPLFLCSSSCGALGSKSSLMGSFVPFGGFFPTPSDIKPQLTALNQPFKRCYSCNEMYEREACSMVKEEGSSVSVSDKYCPTLPSWLQTAESDLRKGADIIAQVKDMKATSNEKIEGLQKKWDDHCQHLHQNITFSTLPRPFSQAPHQNTRGGSSNSSGDTSLTGGVCSSSTSVARNFPSQAKIMTVDFPRSISDFSECHSSIKESPTLGHPIPNLSFPRDHNLSSFVPVTTDLGLGMVYGSNKQNDLNKPFSQGHSKQTIESSLFLGGSGSGGVPNPDDYKSILQKLSTAVSWQCYAVSKISQIVSCCRSNYARVGVWLSFLGPDKVGKRRMAEALADSVFGSRNHLVAANCRSQDRSEKMDSLFICRGLQNFDINASRIAVADHISQELSKKPNSVVFLENIDEADPLVRNSLSRAIQTGKFKDSRGRELSIKNVILVASTTITKDENKTSSPRKDFIKFTEETILEAKNWEMNIQVRTVSGDAANTRDGTRVSLVSPKRVTKQGTLSKRKALDHLEESNKPIKTPKSSLDLNLPLDESEETTEQGIFCGDFLSNGSRAWLDDFLAQTDGNVLFKSYDFDAQADKLLRKIRLKFEEVLKGEKMSLEIDYQVMVQILAVVWCSENKGAVEDWIDQVLGSCFVETRERYSLTPESVVSIVSDVGVPLKNEWATGICLPRSINLSV